MNARQRKKATTGKSPRLIERLLGVARGTCLDAVSFRDEKPRSYHGARFVPTASPLAARPEFTPAEDDRLQAGAGDFQSAPLYLDCDGDGVQHKVEGFTDADGVKHVTLDGRDLGYAAWKRYWDARKP